MMIAYIFASRERPKKFFDCLDNIRAMSHSKEYFVWAKLDRDDYTMCNAAVIQKITDEYPEVFVQWGLSENKVHAINRSLENLPECDILIIMSDDMKWQHNGFDEDIRSAFRVHFPDFDGTIHFPDSHAGSRTMTLSIVGINLYKKLGYLYWPEYISVFCDNDFTEMTRLMGKYVYINKPLFDHFHPIWKMTEWDNQYRRTEDKAIYHKDKETYLKRKANRFGL